MLTSKPMYKENKFWSSSLLPPSKGLELRTSQLVTCSNVLSPLLTLLIVMVVAFHVVVTLQE
jgi:hypothetical protein